MIQLNRNESYWLLDKELVDACKKSLSGDFSRYPDYVLLKESIATYVGVSPDMILVTPGSDIAIEHVARTYTMGDSVVLPIPTFYGYEMILRRLGVQMIPVLYTEQNGKFVFPLEQVLYELTNNTPKVLFLCNPNNPLGCSIPEEYISVMVDACREHGVMLVSDEAYVDFSRTSTLLPYLKNNPNVILLRTFSKGFGLAGARVGYVVAEPEVIKSIELHQHVWPIASTSVCSALVLLENIDSVKKRQDIFVEERDAFIEKLRTIHSITVYSSEANFVLVRVADAQRVYKTLLQAGICTILGESTTLFPEAKTILDNTIRLTIPSPADRSIVLTTLEKAVHLQ